MIALPFFALAILVCATYVFGLMFMSRVRTEAPALAEKLRRATMIPTFPGFLKATRYAEFESLSPGTRRFARLAQLASLASILALIGWVLSSIL